MNASLLQRQAALAGLALLAAVGAIALARDDGPAVETRDAAAPASTWRTAGVGVSRGGGPQCGRRIDETTLGVVHPVLPCGAKLVVRAGDGTVRTQVVGRGTVALDHEFDLTPALAARLDVSGPARIQWRFAE